MSSVIALIPARANSRGISNKNFRTLAGGPSCVQRAYTCAKQAGADRVVVSTDAHFGEFTFLESTAEYLQRPPELATDEAPMVGVVRHALAQVPGDATDVILLLQPTQPLRQPTHLRAAVEALMRCRVCRHEHVEATRCCAPVYDEWWNDYGGSCTCLEPQPDSVVSVVKLPKTHGASWQAYLMPDGRLHQVWARVPHRRQDTQQAYMRDGTVYAFRRRTVTNHGDIYGVHCRPLIIDPSESAALDTPADWEALERRLQEPHVFIQREPEGA